MLRRNGSSGSDRPGSAGSDLARALSVHDHLPWAQEQGQGQAAAGGRAQQHQAEPAVTRTPNQLQRQAQQQLQSHHSSQPELQHTVATAASLVGASGNALPGEDGCEFDDGSSCLAESIEGGGEEDEGDEVTGGGHQDDGNADVVRRDDEEQADQVGGVWRCWLMDGCWCWCRCWCRCQAPGGRKQSGHNSNPWCSVQGTCSHAADPACPLQLPT